MFMLTTLPDSNNTLFQNIHCSIQDLEGEIATVEFVNSRGLQCGKSCQFERGWLVRYHLLKTLPSRIKLERLPFVQSYKGYVWRYQGPLLGFIYDVDQSPGVTTKFIVSCGNTDDDFITENKVVRLGTSGNIKFETPLKAGTFGMTSGCGVYEVYRYLKPDTIRKCLESQSYLSEYQKTTKSMRSDSALNLIALAYINKEIVPDEDSIRILADMQYACSDVVQTPSWFGLVKSNGITDVGLYIKLSERYLEYAQFRNHKPVIGTIPVCIPYNRISEVVGMYVDNDVTSFIVDFNTRSYDMTWMRGFLRAISEYHVEKESILGCVNSFPGSMKKSGEPTSALDFLGFAAGFDVIEDKHVPKPSNDNYPERNETRMFDVGTFTYSKVKYSDKGEREALMAESIHRQVNGMAEVRRSLVESSSIDALLTEKRVGYDVMAPFRHLKSDMSTHHSTLDEFFNRGCEVPSEDFWEP